MIKNLIPVIAKEFGVEIGEEFELQGYLGSKHRFNEDRLEVSFGNEWIKSGLTINALGNIEIIKLLFLSCPCISLGISPRNAITFCIPAFLKSFILSLTVSFVEDTQVKCAIDGTPYSRLIFSAICKVYLLVPPPAP